MNELMWIQHLDAKLGQDHININQTIIEHDPPLSPSFFVYSIFAFDSNESKNTL